MHLRLGHQAFQVRGVTYGSFRARADGHLFPTPLRVAADFTRVARLGLNTVRTYTAPPQDVLDLAEESGLRLIVGLHYDDWRSMPDVGRRTNRRVLDAGRRAVDDAMKRCAGRDGVLAVCVGNEVPGDIVRLHGIGVVEETLSRLIDEVHTADGDLLATYANYPTTEYLQISGQDLACFNVFLEEPEALRRYLRRLQIVAGDVPVVLTELGLASQIHGLDGQAAGLDWQLRIAAESGCAGATVFAWTDEWSVADEPVVGWGFGITDEHRRPKPAAVILDRWAASTVHDLRENWPAMTVVVCAYNEEDRIAECLESLRRLEYPALEVIVCDDGSTDATLAIARRYPFRILALPHGGLSAARNEGIRHARGEIVAFLDADAACHPHWPYHLALSLEGDGVVATGGPNLPVDDPGFVEEAVGYSPGGPIHVLLTDDRAEHVPGCNMAFRRDAIEAIGGFDPVFTTAGDDVDVCWKLIDRGHEIAFSPAAQVRHHRRSTVSGYLRQQRGYGVAERMVAAQHPHRFNRLGQARWRGFIYQGPAIFPKLLRPVIYHGPMGLEPYQGVRHRRSEAVRLWIGAHLPVMVAAAVIAALLAVVSPLFLTVTGIVAVVVLGYAAAVAVGIRAKGGERLPVRMRLLVAALHVAQPLSRTRGRLRRPTVSDAVDPKLKGQSARSWSGNRVDWLRAIEERLRAHRLAVGIGRQYDRWDIRAWAGLLAECRINTAVAWSWIPRARLAVRPRPLAYAGLGVGVVLSVLNLPLGALVLGVLGASAVAEAAVVTRRVRRVLDETTQGARPAAPSLAGMGDDQATRPV